jgi:hypothetical protein
MAELVTGTYWRGGLVAFDHPELAGGRHELFSLQLGEHANGVE